MDRFASNENDGSMGLDQCAHFLVIAGSNEEEKAIHLLGTGIRQGNRTAPRRRYKYSRGSVNSRLLWSTSSTPRTTLA